MFLTFTRKMSAPALHVEAYDWTDSTGSRMFVLGDLNDVIHVFQRIQQELLFRGRKCLVLIGEDTFTVSQRLLIYQKKWDFILRIRANPDYSILAAYLQNSPKPISVLWLGSEIPPVLLQKFESIYWICQNGSLPATKDVYTTFISPSQAPFRYKEWFLAQHATQAHAVLESIEEFRAKKAGIVVRPSRTVNWYDADVSEGISGELTMHEVCQILKWCTAQLEGSE